MIGLHAWAIMPSLCSVGELNLGFYAYQASALSTDLHPSLNAGVLVNTCDFSTWETEETEVRRESQSYRLAWAN